jgi:hypothetical protein
MGALSGASPAGLALTEAKEQTDDRDRDYRVVGGACASLPAVNTARLDGFRDCVADERQVSRRVLQIVSSDTTIRDRAGWRFVAKREFRVGFWACRLALSQRGSSGLSLLDLSAGAAKPGAGLALPLVRRPGALVRFLCRGGPRGDWR